jgi:hypothetical protein
MKFKNTLTACVLALTTMLSIGSYAAPARGETEPVTTPEAQRMMNRLEEIKAMDLANMPRSEKRKYAREVKKIQKKMNAVGGGVYISAGALILIVVLLILLL